MLELLLPPPHAPPAYQGFTGYTATLPLYFPVANPSLHFPTQGSKLLCLKMKSPISQEIISEKHAQLQSSELLDDTHICGVPTVCQAQC